MGQYKNSDFKDSLPGSISANLKLVVEMGGDIHYSVDTGSSENVFSKHYFNMNERHSKNDLYKLVRSKELEKLSKGNYHIVIRGKDKSERKKKEDL
jgi:hypothetical protein